MWKTKLGYTLYQGKDNLKVLQNPWYRWLKFGKHYLQSAINRKNLSKPVLSYIPVLASPATYFPGEVYCLGLGGAGIMHYLAPFLGETPMTAIELNPEVIKVARQFFYVDEIKTLTIIEDEGLHWLQHFTGVINHLIIDLYTENSFPLHCRTPEFFSLCKQVLSPQGFLTINLANFREQLPVFELIKKEFDNSILTLPIPNSGNLVIIAANPARISALLEAWRADKRLLRFEWDAIWGKVIELNHRPYQKN